MATTVYPLHYHCMLCNTDATFYDFFGEDVEGFRQYHYYDEMCIA